MIAAKPTNEEQRLKALQEHAILDTPSEAEFDDVAKLASQICGTPVAFINFIDRDRQWMKAVIGYDLKPEERQTTLEVAFCAHTILQSELLIVRDATVDPRFRDNPFVSGGSIGFYAGAPIIDDSGFALGALCVIDSKPRDLTEAQAFGLKVLANQIVLNLKLRNESRIQLNALQTLEKISRSVPGLIYQFRLYPDGHSTFPYVGENVRELLGVGSEVVKRDGYKIFSNVHASDLNELNQSIQISAEKLSSWRHEFRVSLGDEIRWLRGYSHPEKLSDGSILWHGFLTNITEEKKTQLESIRQSRLSTLGEMSAGIAHEINNPLAIIKGKAMILMQKGKSGNLPPEVLAENLTAIDETVNRIATTIRGLKAFARDGSQDPLVRSSLNAIIEDSINLCQSKFRNRSVELRVEPFFPDAYALVRPSQISQILVNLLQNAFDATLEKSSEIVQNRWICLKTAVTSEWIEMRVSDSGPGVPESLREKILQPFFTTKEIGKGTGLGLSISLGIAKSHGGTLELDVSEKHTTFVLKLPVPQSA
jgi:signal transduction histidine kinase